ncbi:MAG: DUF5063 domain-containing protein [Labilithrix sp.]|nr:DUF5063 domain-containing protein [Labilithrix sp.]
MPTDAGGRKTPICSNYRPTFDLGLSWMGKPVVNDGRIMLIDHDELAPGAEGLVRIEPMFSEFWATVRDGAVVPVQEGAQIVGHVTTAKVIFADGFTPAVATYVWKATEFCTFIQEAGKLPLGERMSGARRYLLALYSAALSLPSVEPTDDVKPGRTPESPRDWQGFEEFETYWEVFDPYKSDEPVAGSLSDDLLDVYRDVRRGLSLWESGHDASAIWEWRFSFESHWGGHAVDALRALHRARGRGD